ncbi:biotin--[acetyl-CoA-carboxylase] ligase [uncultured Jatrophihabitans sp.]|uniref:biotin--[acetyl-CoA-carboxylase] ligase n=1 Tax=uncultured Jatrophihabitans sp. TaxID=1610747 RepID=UPI0035CAE7DA
MDRPPLDVDRLRAGVGDRWARVDVVAETTSTNADLLAAATADASLDRVVLAAEHQIAGRGRLDRVWTSPARAGLTASLLVRPAVPAARWGWLPLLAGVAVVDAVRAETGVECALKWPNDVLARLDGRKLAGILAQTAGGAVVVGVGLNVSTTRDELPVDTATSLALAGSPDVDRTALLGALLAALDSWLTRWTDAGGDPDAAGLAQAYRQRCATLGAQVRVDLGGAAVVGRAVDVDEFGRLLVAAADDADDADDAAAAPRPLAAGDVEHLRPT